MIHALEAKLEGKRFFLFLFSDPPTNVLDKQGNNRWLGMRQEGPWTVIFDVPMDVSLPMYLTRSNFYIGTAREDSDNTLETLVRLEKKLTDRQGNTHTRVALTEQNVIPAVLKGIHQRCVCEAVCEKRPLERDTQRCASETE